MAKITPANERIGIAIEDLDSLVNRLRILSQSLRDSGAEQFAACEGIRHDLINAIDVLENGI